MTQMYKTPVFTFPDNQEAGLDGEFFFPDFIFEEEKFPELKEEIEEEVKKVTDGTDMLFVDYITFDVNNIQNVPSVLHLGGEGVETVNVEICLISGSEFDRVAELTRAYNAGEIEDPFANKEEN